MTDKVVCVASTGGHLEQLHQLHTRLLESGQSAVWVTFDSPQSRSLLADEDEVVFVRRVGSRGYLDLVRSVVPAWQVLRRVRPRQVYSTGAGIALAFLPFAFLVGARAHYIESAARTDGPSLTGKLLRLMPWVRLRTQYRTWAGGRWEYAGSVFDGYVSEPRAEQPDEIRSVLVTLGTQEGYPFVSLVRRLRAIIPDGVQVRWQIGEGFPAGERPPEAHDMISRAELRDWIAEADVIVAHAGVGSALTLLQAGRTPVLVPRSAARGEHIDEHQQLIARELTDRNLAVTAAPDELRWEHLVQAASTTVRRAVEARSA